MAPASILLDTDVFSALAVDPAPWEKRGFDLASWRSALGGASVLISFQTRAEVLSGLRSSKWGEKKIPNAEAVLESTPTIPADAEVIEAFVTLTVACRAAAHGLQQKIHNADRWVAACGIAKGIPLFARDGIYMKAPGLTLIEAPSD